MAVVPLNSILDAASAKGFYGSLELAAGVLRVSGRFVVEKNRRGSGTLSGVRRPWFPSNRDRLPWSLWRGTVSNPSLRAGPADPYGQLRLHLSLFCGDAVLVGVPALVVENGKQSTLAAPFSVRRKMCRQAVRKGMPPRIPAHRVEMMETAGARPRYALTADSSSVTLFCLAFAGPATNH